LKIIQRADSIINSAQLLIQDKINSDFIIQDSRRILSENENIDNETKLENLNKKNSDFIKENEDLKQLLAEKLE